MTTDGMIAEWLTLASERGIYVRSNGRFGITENLPDEIPADHGYAESVTPDVARGLLAAAIHAGRVDGLRAGEKLKSQQPSLLRHVWMLLRNYVTTHATPAIMRHAAERLRQQGRHDPADFCDEKAVEETGHDRLALRDLQALGLDGEKLVEALKPEKGLTLVAYFKACAEGPDPISVLGYAYALERPTLAIGQDRIDQVQALCPVGVNATRCMRVHSAVGADADHVAELVERVAGYRFEERKAIARAVYETTRIIWTSKPGEHPADDEIRQALENVAGRLPDHFHDLVAS